MIQDINSPANNRSWGLSMRSFEQETASNSYLLSILLLTTLDGNKWTLSSDSIISLSWLCNRFLRLISFSREGIHCSSNCCDKGSKKNLFHRVSLLLHCKMKCFAHLTKVIALCFIVFKPMFLTKWTHPGFCISFFSLILLKEVPTTMHAFSLHILSVKKYSWRTSTAIQCLFTQYYFWFFFWRRCGIHDTRKACLIDRE